MGAQLAEKGSAHGSVKVLPSVLNKPQRPLHTRSLPTGHQLGNSRGAFVKISLAPERYSASRCLC